MEGKNQQKIDSKIFKIPIEEYEIDIETESAKKKKTEIFDLLTNCNNIHSEKEYEEIENKLHKACKKGDIELIKIYLNERIESDSKDIVIKIDKQNQTASLFKVNCFGKQITIPRIVKHESIEYLINSISGIGGLIETLNFVEDSAVKTIYKDVFPILPSIKEIYFPPSLKELKEGWCYGTFNLNKITISPSNEQFMMKDNKYIIGKSDDNKDEFDNILFGCRDIKEISIPANIKIISSSAFHDCKKLEKVEIPQNSNLQIIGGYAFLHSIIKEIYFPSSLKVLKKGWCCGIDKLTKITISPSNNRFIMKENKILLGKSDENKDEFDTILYGYRDIKEISIPSNIKIISSYAFHNCTKLAKIEISPNSDLQTIERSAFSCTDIDKILIPQKVSKICQCAFHGCPNQIKVEIPPNSDLQAISKFTFSGSEIKEFSIPSKVTKICEGAFHYCKNLKKVEISSNSNLQLIEKDAFSDSTIEEFCIPPKVTKICENAFNSCFHLTKVEIPSNSDLQIIGKNAFSFSKIKEFLISSKVTKICEMAFFQCKNLTKIEISPNSNLQMIGMNAFTFSKIKDFFIPSKVTQIYEYAFISCFNLQVVEISEESKLKSFPLSAFDKCPNLIIMIPQSLKKMIQRTKEFIIT